LELLVSVLFVLGSAGLIALQVGKRRRLCAAWKRAALDAGLSDIEEGGGHMLGRAVRGRSGALQVEIGEYSDRQKGSVTQVSLTGYGYLNDLALRPETLGTRLQKRLLTSEIDTGDPEFDATFFVHGTRAVVHASLGEAARRRIGVLHSRVPLTIRGGSIRVELHGDRMAAELTGILSDVLELGRAIEGKVITRVATNARRDPLAAVRLRNLQVLIEEFPTEPETDEALRGACDDDDTPVRLCAALALGIEGKEVLREIVKTGQDDACVGRALTALGSEIGADAAKPMLVQALEKDAVATAIACLDIFGHESLADVEALLVKALDHGSSELRTAAARALGRGGTVAAVLPLDEATTRHGGPGFRAVVRQAIAEIQARVTGASQGQVSLTDADTGRVSLAAADGGEVSLSARNADTKPSDKPDPA
jgi:hypothetical protein